jgi:transglutaminase-like putative cysteine protease
VGTGTGISTGVNPAINLGDDLRRGTAVNVLSYRTDATNGEYLKLVDLVDFSGRQWSPASVKLNAADNVSKLPAAPGIAATTRRDTQTTKVSVSLLRSPYLPIPVPATKVTGIDDRWKYVDASGVTIRSTTEGSQGLDYSVTSRPVNPTRRQIVASLGQTPADLSAYTSVKGVPASISSLAKKVTAGAANPFDAAVDLQDYFRDGDFTYSEDTPVAGGYDGTGLDAIEVFLQRKSGYCVHFASAMAVMARTLGIPSRIAVGFLPGTQDTSNDTWTVTSNDLHTWPELYFQGLGWVPFEPTVGQGTTSAYLQQTGAEATPSASATAAPTGEATAAPTASAAPTTQAGPTEQASSTSSAAAAATSGGGGVPVLFGGILVLVLLALTPWWLRTARRRRRLGAGPPDAALSAWREVVDTARDLGIPVDPGATPQVTAAQLAGVVSDAPDRASGSPPALDRLLAAVQAERFGGSPATPDVHDAAREVIAALRAGSSGATRTRAVLAPRSLFAEQRPRTVA